MNIIRNTCRIFVLASIISVMLNSCICDSVTSLRIKNNTKDTLFLELMESDTLNDDIYWNRHSDDTIGMILPEDTAGIYIHGEKVILWMPHCTLPDSASFFAPYLFSIKDTCYIYAIKWQVLTHYSLKEICARKLYDRRAVTKKDFNNRIYEYRPLRNAKY